MLPGNLASCVFGCFANLCWVYYSRASAEALYLIFKPLACPGINGRLYKFLFPSIVEVRSITICRKKEDVSANVLQLWLYHPRRGEGVQEVEICSRTWSWGKEGWPRDIHEHSLEDCGLPTKNGRVFWRKVACFAALKVHFLSLLLRSFRIRCTYFSMRNSCNLDLPGIGSSR